MIRDLLNNPLNWLIGWIKRHLLLITGLIVFAAFLLFEMVTTFVAVCRDAYITTDIALIAPDGAGPERTRFNGLLGPSASSARACSPTI